jgi:hypothetical protein
MSNDNLAGQIYDVFSLEEIENIKKILKVLPDQKNPSQKKDILNNGFKEGDPVWPMIKKLVMNRINDVLPIKVSKLSVGMQLIARDPYGVHTDYNNKGDTGPGMALLIPLHVKSATDIPSFTVIFDQEFTVGNTIYEYADTNPDIPATNADEIWHLLPQRDEPHLSKYLSVKLLAEWRIGSLIYWDRKLLHSSDDFRLKGITEKSALVLFTSFDA